jgi:hypothetical protein
MKNLFITLIISLLSLGNLVAQDTKPMPKKYFLGGYGNITIGKNPYSYSSYYLNPATFNIFILQTGKYANVYLSPTFGIQHNENLAYGFDITAGFSRSKADATPLNPNVISQRVIEFGAGFFIRNKIKDFGRFKIFGELSTAYIHSDVTLEGTNSPGNQNFYRINSGISPLITFNLNEKFRFTSQIGGIYLTHGNTSRSVTNTPEKSTYTDFNARFNANSINLGFEYLF